MTFVNSATNADSRIAIERAWLNHAADLIETGLLVFLFASLILKGFILHRDLLYSYVGGFVLFAFVTLRYYRRIFLVNTTILTFTGFAAWVCASALWAHDKYLVFLDAREVVAAIPVMVAVYHICSTEAGLRRVFLTLKIVLIAAVVLTLASGAYSYRTREFLAMDSSVITPFMLMSFVLLFMERQVKKRCVLCLASMVITIVPILIVSSVRSVVVVLAIIGTYVFLLNASTALGRVVAVVAATGLVAGLMAYGSVIMTSLEGTRYFRHYSHMQAYMEEGALEGSVGFRLMVQDLGVDMIKERPILGHGFNNSRYMYQRWIGMPTYSHSGFMEILIGLGTIGLLLFLWVLREVFATYRRIWSSSNRGAAAGLAVLCGYFIFCFIGPVYSAVELLLSIALLTSPGMLASLRRASGSVDLVRAHVSDTPMYPDDSRRSQ